MKMDYVLEGIEMAEAKAMLRKIMADAKAPEDGYITHETEGYIDKGAEIFTYDHSHRFGHIDRYCAGLYITYIIDKYRATSREWGVLKGRTNAAGQPIPRCEITKKPVGDDNRAYSIMIHLDY